MHTFLCHPKVYTWLFVLAVLLLALSAYFQIHAQNLMGDEMVGGSPVLDSEGNVKQTVDINARANMQVHALTMMVGSVILFVLACPGAIVKSLREGSSKAVEMM